MQYFLDLFKKKRLPALIGAFTILAFILLMLYNSDYKENIISDFNNFMSGLYRIERGFLENIPLYEDYADPSKEKKLRRYLLESHLKAADDYGLPPVNGDEEIIELSKRGRLTSIEGSKDRLYYFYNVQHKYRYLTPPAYNGLKAITERFQENIKKRKELPPVKIAISSVMRPVSYQKKLNDINYNAAIVSTHSRGISFDIFFDDYFIKLPDPSSSNSVSGVILEKLNNKFGFVLGDSLRRQFKAILMETLIGLQDEGLLYAILEKRQRCYHVTVLQK